MSTLAFDLRNVQWYTPDDLPHVANHICAVDEGKRIVDILFKFDENEKIVLHRHKADYITLVLQGEAAALSPQRRAQGLKEIRPVGSYVEGKADSKPHIEGDDQGLVAFFGNRHVDDLFYEF